jgi:hypothetical protein
MYIDLNCLFFITLEVLYLIQINSKIQYKSLTPWILIPDYFKIFYKVFLRAPYLLVIVSNFLRLLLTPYIVISI